MPRIIAGKYKSISLDSPKDLSTRPSADRLKEAMFSILEVVLKQHGLSFFSCDVLDLYSGSGSLGLEACSRGAKECVLADSSNEAIKTIKKNMTFLKTDNVKSIKASWPKDLNKLKENSFNLFFLDPPYKEYEEIIKILALLIEKNIAKENSFLIWELSSENVKNLELTALNNWQIIKVRLFGNKAVAVLKNF